MAEASTTTSTTPKASTTDPTDALVKDAQKAKDDAKAERDKQAAAAVARGEAPPYDPADPRSREEKEAANAELLAAQPAPQVGPSDEAREVTVDGVRYLIEPGAEPPAEAREILQQSAQAARTSQMRHGSDGTQTVRVKKA